MKNAFIHGSLIFQIFIVVMFNCFMTGCGGDEDDVDTLYVDTLYRELVGTYELFRGELTFPDGSEIVLESPNITGRMTISSNRGLTQEIEVDGNSVVLKGSFEILPDEGVIEIDNETVDLISRATYTWDGSIFTTTLDVGTYIEKDFWRKL